MRGTCGATMACKLILAVLVTTAAFGASQAGAQSADTTQSIAPVANTTGKQDKRAVTPPQTAAPKSTPARGDKKSATASAKPADAAAPRPTSASPHDAKKEVPRIQSNPLGRVTVDGQGSTFGFSAETKMNMYATPDGQRIRGMDHQMTNSRQPNYFGLSLSVPTTGTSSGGSDAPRGLFPLPPRP